MAYHDEKVAHLRARSPGERILDVGYDSALLDEAGMPPGEFRKLLGTTAESLPHEGAFKLMLHLPDGRQLLVYALRRGDKVEFGGRSLGPNASPDFRKFWSEMCALVDRLIKER